jgi:hypothetical protein
MRRSGMSAPAGQLRKILPYDTGAIGISRMKGVPAVRAGQDAADHGGGRRDEATVGTDEIAGPP